MSEVKRGLPFNIKRKSVKPVVEREHIDAGSTKPTFSAENPQYERDIYREIIDIVKRFVRPEEISAEIRKLEEEEKKLEEEVKSLQEQIAKLRSENEEKSSRLSDIRTEKERLEYFLELLSSSGG